MVSILPDAVFQIPKQLKDRYAGSRNASASAPDRPLQSRLPKPPNLQKRLRAVEEVRLPTRCVCQSVAVASKGHDWNQG